MIPELAPELLSALIHELRQPISAASLAAGQEIPPMALLRFALRRTVRSLDAFAWWARRLASDPRAPVSSHVSFSHFIALTYAIGV